MAEGQRSHSINTIKAREILDSRGNPTVEVEIELGGIGLSPFVDLLNDFILRFPSQIP